MPQGFVSFAEVKRAVTMEALLARYGLLAGMAEKGRNLAGSCPFCKGKSARRFQVNLVKSAWYCFGCKQGGNVLDFVAKREGVSVRTAAVKLDTWFELGLVEKKEELRAEAPAAPAERSVASVEPPPEANEAAPAENLPLAFTLKTLDPNHDGLAELELRAETIERFAAGYCTKGLLKGRLAIPIHSGRGELLAYRAGLAVEDGSETPRYLFPPKFHPALEVFNLHRAHGSHRGEGTALPRAGDRGRAEARRSRSGLRARPLRRLALSCAGGSDRGRPFALRGLPTHRQGLRRPHDRPPRPLRACRLLGPRSRGAIGDRLFRPGYPISRPPFSSLLVRRGGLGGPGFFRREFPCTGESR